MTTAIPTATTRALPHVHPEDIAFFERELDAFVPDKVFDAHVHLWAPDHYTSAFDELPDTLGYHQMKSILDVQYPGRELAALLIPFPYPTSDDPSAWKNHSELANDWITSQVSLDPRNRGLFNVEPTHDPEWVRQEVRRRGLHGLKCYHYWSASKPTWESDIPGYLPEPLIKVAHEEGWCITLHMVKQRAVADPQNIHWIRHYCKTYPNMKLILAHSARGHNPSHNLEGLPQLRGLDNLYFDTSAVCESTAHEAILRIIGHEKLLFGSDFLGLRGRCMAVDDSFIWLQESSPVWSDKHLQVKPVHCSLESTRALKWACWSAGLKDPAVEDVFWNNAAGLFNI